MRRQVDSGFSAHARDAKDDEDWSESSDDHSILADLVRRLWRSRAWFLYPALVGALLSFVVLAIVNFLSPSTTSYRFAISLTMPGAADGKYANGLPYAPSDLRSASVLNEVFRRNDLERYGFDRSKFSSMVAVAAYSPVHESIVERYRSQLSVRNITAEERQRFGDEFASALRKAAAEGALVTFTVPDDLKMPKETGLKVVADIPAVWSDIYVNVLGAGLPAMARSEGAVLDGDYAKSLDYPLSYDYTVMGLNRLTTRLDEIQGQPGAQNAVLLGKNETVLDIMNKVQRIRLVEIGRILRPIINSGLTRDKALTTLSYEHAIENMKDDEKLALQRAEIVSSIVSESDAVSEFAARGTQPGQSPDAAGPALVTSIPQFGDVFIDRIVGMALSGAGADFRQTLLRQKLALAESAANTAKERVETERRLDAIRGFDVSNPTMAAMAERFDAALGRVVDDVNELWADANGILDTIGTRNLSSDRQVYTSMELQQPISRTAFWRSPYFLIGAGGAIVALGVAGLLLHALWELVRSRRTPKPA